MIVLTLPESFKYHRLNIDSVDQSAQYSFPELVELVGTNVLRHPVNAQECFDNLRDLQQDVMFDLWDNAGNQVGTRINKMIDYIGGELITKLEKWLLFNPQVRDDHEATVYHIRKDVFGIRNQPVRRLLAAEIMDALQ